MLYPVVKFNDIVKYTVQKLQYDSLRKKVDAIRSFRPKDPVVQLVVKF
jgi:hypothetical protein